MTIKSIALTLLLGLSLICACTAAFGVGHPDGTFATPDDGDSYYVSFKHINNTNSDDYPYGYFEILNTECLVYDDTYCVTECDGVTELAAATLTSIPTIDIAVTSLVFNTEGVSLIDATSNFCAVRDGAGKVWAIDRDLPSGSNITTANSFSRIIPCMASDIFSPVTGCPPRAPPPRPDISIKGGFINLDTTGGAAPHDAYCAETAHNGRMVVDDVNDVLYICTQSGWTTFSSDISPLP